MFRVRWRVVGKFLGHCFIATACIEILILLASDWQGWRYLFWDLTRNFILCVEIGGLAWMTIPFVAHRLSYRHPVVRWSGIVLALTAVAGVGTYLAVAVAQILAVLGMNDQGQFGSGRPFMQAYWQTLTSATPITLFIGILTTVLETGKERLRITEGALRDQQFQRERAEKLAAEAQLASLASRVQPHFLFNTLNSIASLIREDPRQAEQMVERLGSLLRGSLDAAEIVPLDQEMKLVSDYLEIQQVRLGERLRYELDWQPQSFNGAKVPPFAVQTLVENALKHVAGVRQEGVVLRLSARADAADLTVDVEDNGSGFEPEALRTGHGLDNLQQRLRALYGDRAGLDFERLPSGMRVRLRVPAS